MVVKGVDRMVLSQASVRKRGVGSGETSSMAFQKTSWQEWAGLAGVGAKVAGGEQGSRSLRSCNLTATKLQAAGCCAGTLLDVPPLPTTYFQLRSFKY